MLKTISAIFTYLFIGKIAIIKIPKPIPEQATIFVEYVKALYCCQALTDGPNLDFSKTQYSNFFELLLKKYTDKIKKHVDGKPGSIEPKIPRPTLDSPKTV